MTREMTRTRKLVFLRFLLAVLLLLFFLRSTSSECDPSVESTKPNALGNDESFREELAFRRLSNGMVLAHFVFSQRMTTPNGMHFTMFPGSIAQLARQHRLKEMDLSLTRGRWDYQRWGTFESVNKPPGIELVSSFFLPPSEVVKNWGMFTHALSSLFCSSIGRLENATAISSLLYNQDPHFSALKNTCNADHRMDGGSNSKTCHSTKSFWTNDGGKGTRMPEKYFYGVLNREPLCTENLTPWIQLLPCRDESGIASLLKRAPIFESSYHSLRTRIVANDHQSEMGFHPPDFSLFLQQSLTVVFKPKHRPSPSHPTNDWSISSLFGTQLNDFCFASDSSVVNVELQDSFVDAVYKDQGFNKSEDPNQNNRAIPRGQRRPLPDAFIDGLLGLPASEFSIQPKPHKAFKQYDGGQSFVGGCSFCDSSECEPSGCLNKERSEIEAEMAPNWERPSLVVLHYDLQSESVHFPFNLMLKFGSHTHHLIPSSLFYVQRLLSGKGDERGRIVLLFNSPHFQSFNSKIDPNLETSRMQSVDFLPTKSSDSFDAGGIPEADSDLNTANGESDNFFYDMFGFEEQGWRKIDNKEKSKHQTMDLDQNPEQFGVNIEGEKTPHRQVNRVKSEMIWISIIQFFPSFLHLYYHTLSLFVNENHAPFSSSIELMNIDIDKGRKRGHSLLEVVLKLPANVSKFSLSIEFEKRLLSIDEYPADASRGMDIPSGIVGIFQPLPSDTNGASGCNIESSLRVQGRYYRVYLPPLTVSLPIPDFSMPYNVITLTSTIFAIFFGSVLNMLKRRNGELRGLEKLRLNGLILRLKSKFRLTKRLKIFLTMFVFVSLWFYYTLQ